MARDMFANERAAASADADADPADREALGRLVREIWVAWARENPVRCDACRGGCAVYPYCRLCEDSTCDHECPRGDPCTACGGSGKRPKPSWVAPWEELSESDREVDRRIGEALYRRGVEAKREAMPRLVARVRELETELARLPQLEAVELAAREYTEACDAAAKTTFRDPGWGAAHGRMLEAERQLDAALAASRDGGR